MNTVAASEPRALRERLWLLAGVLALGLFLGWILLDPRVPLLRVPLPQRQVPLPIEFWVGLAGWGWIMARALGLSFRELLPVGALAGLVSHLTLLLGDLDRTILATPTLLKPGPYLLYYHAVLVGWTLAVGVWTGWLLRETGTLRDSFASPAADWLAGLPVGLAGLALALGFGSAGRFWLLGLFGAGLAVGLSRISPRSLCPLLALAGRRWVFLAGLAGLALLTRVAFAVRLVAITGENFILAGDDTDTYHRFAETFAGDAGTLFTLDPRAQFPPAYWIVLGSLYHLVGTNFFVVAVVNAVLGALVPLAVYALGRRLAGENVGRVAGLLAVLNATLVHLAIVTDQESVYLPLLVLALVLVLKASDEGGLGRFALAGLVLGAANAIRPVTLFLPLALAAWVGLTARRRALAGALLLLAMSAFPPGLVTLRNYVSSGGEFIPVTIEAGTHYEVGGNERLVALGINPFRRPLGSVVAVATRPAESVEAIVTTVTPRVVKFFFEPFFGQFDFLSIVNPRAEITRFGVTMDFYTYAFILLGIALVIRRGDLRPRGVLLLTTAYFSLLPVLWLVRNATYRAPLHPVFALFAAVALVACLAPGFRRLLELEWDLASARLGGAGLAGRPPS